MKNITFIRTAPYSYTQLHSSLYESLDHVGMQSVQPHLSAISEVTKQRIEHILEHVQPTHVFSSAFIRSQDTAQLFSEQHTATTALNEIKFSMHDFSTPEQLGGEVLEPAKINAIRYQFAQTLLSDGLQEKQHAIFERMNTLAEHLRTLPEDSSVLCLSHGFIMKLYENFFRYHCNVAHSTQIITDYDWTRAPFGFLDGFTITNDSHITTL